MRYQPVGVVVFYPLNVTITPDLDQIWSGGQTLLVISVSIGSYFVPSASVNVSASSGTVAPTTGLTNASGIFDAQFSAPTVAAPTNITISAFASHNGTLGGRGETLVTVRPLLKSAELSIPLNVIVIAALIILAAGVGTAVVAIRWLRRSSKAGLPGSPPQAPVHSGDSEVSQSKPSSPAYGAEPETFGAPWTSPQPANAPNPREQTVPRSPAYSAEAQTLRTGQPLQQPPRPPSSPVPGPIETRNVTGEVRVPASMNPWVTYPLRVALIGEMLAEETKTVNGTVLEMRPFEATTTGPITISPHGDQFEVRPASHSLAIPPIGGRYAIIFNISRRSDEEGGTKVLVDFLQDGRLLRQANADVRISKTILPAQTVIVTTQIPARHLPPI